MTKNNIMRKLPDLPHTNPTKLEIEAAFRRLASEGLIYDTGKKRWSERYQEYQIVWAAVERKAFN
jgi:hypothetical protein